MMINETTPLEDYPRVLVSHIKSMSETETVGGRLLILSRLIGKSEVELMELGFQNPIIRNGLTRVMADVWGSVEVEYHDTSWVFHMPQGTSFANSATVEVRKPTFQDLFRIPKRRNSVVSVDTSGQQAEMITGLPDDTTRVKGFLLHLIGGHGPLTTENAIGQLPASVYMAMRNVILTHMSPVGSDSEPSDDEEPSP